jgi:hypothetical protein
VHCTGGVDLPGLAPCADIPFGHGPLFLSVEESVRVVCDLLTCVFLCGQFALRRSTGVLIFAGGYRFSAAIALLHERSFPRLFARDRRFGAQYSVR